MRSKFINNICFINDKYYHNRRDKSPYVFIKSIEREESSLDNSYLNIYYINIHGKKGKMSQHRSWLYNNLEILKIENYSHIAYDFIRRVFNG